VLLEHTPLQVQAHVLHVPQVNTAQRRDYPHQMGIVLSGLTLMEQPLHQILRHVLHVKPLS